MMIAPERLQEVSPVSGGFVRRNAWDSCFVKRIFRRGFVTQQNEVRALFSRETHIDA